MKEYVHGYNTGRLVKDSGSYVNVADILDSSVNDFGEIRTALRYPQLTLTGAEFDYLGNYNESERALQYDVKATAITGGECIYDTFVSTARNNQDTLRSIDVTNKFVSEFDTISLVARTESGSATVKSILRNQEKW